MWQASFNHEFDFSEVSERGGVVKSEATLMTDNRENDDPTYVVGIDGTGELAEIADDANNFHEYILSTTIDDGSKEGWILAGKKYAGDLVKQGVREQL